MLCIDSRNSNPFFNLAAEEFLLRNSGEEYFMVWQSTPLVVVGKHQNALAEINYRFAKEQGITIARRLTGGGTVYHDGGNINFTFIRKGEPGKLVNFTAFMEPVIAFLNGYGVEVIQGPKHEIMAGGKKISGNAEHVFKDRILHHGTLLFGSDLELLRKVIDHRGGLYTDRAVQSNRSSVLNLSQILSGSLDVSDFRELLFDYVKKYFGGTHAGPDDRRIAAIQKLANDKYSTWEWIYGWSPDYSYENTWEGRQMKIRIELHVHRGMISVCQLNGGQTDLSEVMHLLTGSRHAENNIREALERTGLKNALITEEFEDLVYAFF